MEGSNMEVKHVSIVKIPGLTPEMIHSVTQYPCKQLKVKATEIKKCFDYGNDYCGYKHTLH